MQIETQRLNLIALTARQLNLLINDIERLESELGVKYEAEPLEGEFLQIVKAQAQITDNDPDNYMWHSFWLIVRKSDNTVVGSSDFKYPPDKNGVVEIGYGLSENFRKNGYMCETVKAMCEWAAGQNEVNAVIAETETDNIASHRVLSRCGFVCYKKEETFWWKLSVKDNPVSL